MLFNLQILRAYAAFAVVFFHINVPGMHTGGFGVHVFFVISGFIIARSCDVNPRHFFLRRLIRIVPAYWACTLGLFIIAAFRPELLNSTTADVGHLIKSLFFIPFERENGLVQPILNVGWTLNYEMLFYSLVAIGIMIVGARWAPLFASCFLVTQTLLLPLACRSTICSFYVNNIMLEFCFGMAAYELWRRQWLSRLPQFFWTIAAFASAVLLPIVEMSHPQTAKINPNHLDLGVISMTLVLAAAMLESPKEAPWKKPLIVIGDASYLIYLIHMYVIQFFVKILVPRVPAFAFDSMSGVVLCMLLVCLISVTLHIAVEKPVIEYLKNRLTRLRPARF